MAGLSMQTRFMMYCWSIVLFGPVRQSIWQQPYISNFKKLGQRVEDCQCIDCDPPENVFLIYYNQGRGAV